MITTKEKQDEALQTILEGGEPDTPTVVAVPAMPGDEEEDDGDGPPTDEKGIYEYRPREPEVGDKWYGDSKHEVWEKKEYGLIRDTRQDEARSPLFCPECGGSLNSYYDQKFYRMTGMCMDCVQKQEEKMRVEGTYEYYEKKKLLHNKRDWLSDIKEGLEEFKKQAQKDVKDVVREGKQIVKWDGISDEELEDMIDNAEEFIANFEGHIEELREEVNQLEPEQDQDVD